MVAEEQSYEDSLAELNEDMLRTECIRLHNELMRVYKNLLMRPVQEKRNVEETQAELDVLIQQKRQEFSEICEPDMSEPTTAELNVHREIQALIKRRREVAST